MEYKDFSGRIDNVDKLSDILKEICENYSIKKYLKHKIIELGYEDFIVVLDTTEGKYFVKILNKERTDEQCLRLANIYSIARENNVSVPMIYSVNNEAILFMNFNGELLRILLMEYIDGKNMYTLSRDLTFEEIGRVAHEAAIINRIDFDVDEYYDEWTITNFESEYNRKINEIDEEYRKIVAKVHEEFIKINLDKLPKTYIHGDIMNANLILDKDEKIWLIDFSALNYLPRIIELVVIVYGICITDDRDEFIKRVNYFLSVYNSLNEITAEELEVFPIVLNTMSAMSVMQAAYIKATMENFEENEYWIEVGKRVIDKNLRREDINISSNI